MILLIVFGMVLLMRSIAGQISKIKWKRSPTAFSKENGYSYDVVFVMPIYDADQRLTWWQQKYSHQYIIQLLTNAGMWCGVVWCWAIEFVAVVLCPEPPRVHFVSTSMCMFVCGQASKPRCSTACNKMKYTSKFVRP